MDDGYEQCDGTGGVLSGALCNVDCFCDTGSYFCALADACVPDARPCTYIDKSASVTGAMSGDTVVHTITISNPTSGDWTGVTLLDILPDTLSGTFVPPEDSATASGNTTVYAWTGITLTS